MVISKKMRNILIHTGAGVVAVVLVAFGATQCSRKKTASAERDENGRHLVEAIEVIRDTRHMLDSVANVSDSLRRDNRVMADSILVLNDSIDSLNDQLEDCRGAKKSGARKAGVRRPAPKRGSENKVNVTLRPGAQNGGTIIIANDGALRNETEVLLDSVATNQGSIIISNGAVVVNSGAGAQNAAGGDIATADTALVAKQMFKPAVARITFVNGRAR